jgi:hypothetical protein
MQNTDKMAMKGRRGTAQKVFLAALKTDTLLANKPLSFVRKTLQLPEGLQVIPSSNCQN